MRPLTPADVPTIQRLLAQPINSAALGGGQMGGMEQTLLKTMSGTYALAFGFEIGDKLVAAGSLNSIDHINRSAEIGVMVMDNALNRRQRLSIGWRFGGEIVDHAFDDLNLRRVFSRTLKEFPLLSHMPDRFAGMVSEGVLRQAVYQAGEYHDVEIWGLLRDDYVAMNQLAEQRNGTV